MTSRAKSGPISASGSSTRGEMAVAAHEWLELIEREYLTDFITAGGGAVKFVVGDAHQLMVVARVLDLLSERHGLAHVTIDAATTIQDVAERNRVDVTLLRRDFRQWLTAEVMRDTEMTQDFRVAMTQLCLQRLE